MLCIGNAVLTVGLPGKPLTLFLTKKQVETPSLIGVIIRALKMNQPKQKLVASCWVQDGLAQR